MLQAITVIKKVVIRQVRPMVALAIIPVIWTLLGQAQDQARHEWWRGLKDAERGSLSESKDKRRIFNSASPS
jgi:hypothetical protein